MRTFVLALLFLTVASPAYADLGPKPRMGFQFAHEGVDSSVVVTEGQFITNGEALEEMGPQGFACINNKCSAIAYSFGDGAHQLDLQFSDGKTRTSEPFQRIGFDSEYVVTVRPDSLTVSPSTSTLAWHWGLRGGVVAVFLLAASAIALLLRRRKKS